LGAHGKGMEKNPAESIGILDCREEKKVMKMKNREKFLSCHDNGSFKEKKKKIASRTPFMCKS
jgi:hypothetical protein